MADTDLTTMDGLRAECMEQMQRAAGLVQANRVARDLLEQSQAEVERLRADSERLEFMISTLNEMGLFSRWVNMWLHGLQTTLQRATSLQWREWIDAARDAQ